MITTDNIQEAKPYLVAAVKRASKYQSVTDFLHLISALALLWVLPMLVY